MRSIIKGLVQVPGPGVERTPSAMMRWRCLMLAAKPRRVIRDEVNSACMLVAGRA